MDIVQEAYQRDGYAIIDDFLFTSVVDELHDLAVNYEDVDDKYDDYHSINFTNEKFPFEILPDVINAIHVTFPVLHSLEFDRGWAFVCDNQGEGVTPHADPASINVNLWVTPNDCAEDPTKNGLVIYDKKPPEDWEWSDYNSNEDKARKYLKESGAKARYIPYNYNRIILFLTCVYSFRKI